MDKLTKGQLLGLIDQIKQKELYEIIDGKVLNQYEMFKYGNSFKISNNF